MKILYIKNNSERNRAYQLKTIIYEENGKKYVKKEALAKEAIPHLMKMKESRTALINAALDPKIAFPEIIGEDKNSLTFEFIDGISFEEKFRASVKSGKANTMEIIEDYISLLTKGFKIVPFDSRQMVTDEFKLLFGNLDFSALNGKACFEGISNIDQIFSNLISRDDKIYIIDHEWSFFLNIPVEFVVHRTMEMAAALTREFKNDLTDNTFLYNKMESHFIAKYVMKDSFYFQKKNYLKPNAILEHLIEGKEEHIKELSSRMHTIGDDLAYARSIVEMRDKELEAKNAELWYWSETAESLRLKNRLKRLTKKVVPNTVLNALGFTPHPQKETEEKENKEAVPVDFGSGYAYHSPELTMLVKNEMELFVEKPLISIIMPVYNVDPKWLEIAIKSVEAQWYDNWELCIVDDKSTNEETVAYLKNIQNSKVKIAFLEKNLNISGASNAAIELSSGEYIALMDNDDEITPDALYEVIKCINETNADFIYSDEDFISEEGILGNPHYKPDFSPDLLLSHNYITHFTCFRRSLLERTGYFNPEFDGSQDYDLFLRLTEKTSNISHIPKVLYHWRTLESSTSMNSEAKPEALDRGRRVLEDTLRRRGIEGSVEHGNMHHYFRVKYAIHHKPLVSIIIPFKDKAELLEVCVNSILEKSTYQHYEIIGISNNSKEQETFSMMAALERKDPRVLFYEYNVDFNYADINNHAVNNYANGEHILLLNNDIEVISSDWIESMLEHSQRQETGCIGAKLYHSDDTVQHAGIIMGLGGYAGHSHKMYRRDNAGYFNRLNAIQNLSAVTAACLMIKKSIYEEVGGMDDVNFKVAYNDVDFCLRVREKDYLNIFTPFAELYHYESLSRGYETTPEKIERFQTEKDALFERHREILENGDPYYNANLTLDREDFSLRDKKVEQNDG